MYQAEFDPQVWLNNHAFSIDPVGDTVWDCTTFLHSNPELKSQVDAALAKDGHFLDLNDELRDDPAIPAWTKEHAGPFTITVTGQPAAPAKSCRVCLVCGEREKPPLLFRRKNLCSACVEGLYATRIGYLVDRIDNLLGQVRPQFTAELPQCAEAARLLTARLAQLPLPSMKSLSPVNRFESTRTMLGDLQRLAQEDGCVAAGWALELAQHVDNDRYYLTTEVRDTILGALRLYQRKGLYLEKNRPLWLEDIVSDGGSRVPLTGDELEALLEQLNRGGGEAYPALFTSSWDDGKELCVSRAAIDEAHRLVVMEDNVEGPEDGTLREEYVTYRGRKFAAAHISDRDDYSKADQAKMFFYK